MAVWFFNVLRLCVSMFATWGVCLVKGASLVGCFLEGHGKPCLGHRGNRVLEVIYSGETGFQNSLLLGTMKQMSACSWLHGFRGLYVDSQKLTLWSSSESFLDTLGGGRGNWASEPIKGYALIFLMTNKHIKNKTKQQKSYAFTY